MKAGIVAAMAPELRAFTAERVRPGQIATLSNGMLAAVCGIGAARARDAAIRLADAGATALLSWGCAAALAPHLRVGTLLVPQCVVPAQGRNSSQNETYRADVHWHAQLLHRLSGFAIETEALAEAEALLQTATDKASLANSAGAVAADMETAAIGRVASERGIPFIAIRAVSDEAHVGVSASLARIATDGDRPRAIAKLALTPSDWPAAARLGFGFRAALATLARARRALRGQTRFFFDAPEIGVRHRFRNRRYLTRRIPQ